MANVKLVVVYMPVGIKLIIGINASIDHIMPTSKGGTNETSNLQWVDKWVNWAKSNLSHNEFIEKIKSLYEYQMS